MTPQSRIEVQGIVKRFGSTVALAGVDLTLESGEVHALLGENGAGKSTLTRIIAGDYQPNEGQVAVDGQVVQFRSPADALERGIRLVTQERALVPSLSVAENLFLGRLPTKRFGMVDWEQLVEAAAEPLASVGLDLDPMIEVERLAPAQQQLVEIAKALVGTGRVLVLDEPTAALTMAETDQLFDVIRRVRADGWAVMYISHRLDELAAIADTCTILRDGVVAASLPMSEADAASVAELMVGQPLGEMYARTRTAAGETILRATGVGVPDLLENIDLEVRSGEIVALYGLVGSGATEIPYVLSGHLAHTGAVDHHVGRGFVPMDRREEGLFLEATTRRNLTAASLDRHGASLLHSRRSEVTSARNVMTLLDVRPDDPEAPITALSGGNQQKAMVGRWLEADVGVLLMSEPTRGVDVGARRDIYELLGQACERGMGILVASSDLDEVVGLADRVLVVRNGKITDEISGSNLTAERLFEAATR